MARKNTAKGKPSVTTEEKDPHLVYYNAFLTAVTAGTRPEFTQPTSNFMCFKTDEKDVYLKADWNPTEQRYNKNLRRATREECIGGN